MTLKKNIYPNVQKKNVLDLSGQLFLSIQDDFTSKCQHYEKRLPNVPF